MRIRLAITLDVVRPRKPEPSDGPTSGSHAPEQEHAPQVDAKGAFSLERAGEQRIGFEIPRTFPRWWDEATR